VLWDAPGADLTLTVLTATGLSLDGRPPGDVLRVAPGTDPAADVDASPLENQRAVLQTLGGTGEPAVRVEWAGPAAAAVTVG
jgi:hypothetical protein